MCEAHDSNPDTFAAANSLSNSPPTRLHAKRGDDEDEEDEREEEEEEEMEEERGKVEVNVDGGKVGAREAAASLSVEETRRARSKQAMPRLCRERKGEIEIERGERQSVMRKNE